MSFFCGSAAATLTGQNGAYPTSGCFNVTISAQDITTGSMVNVLAATCGGASAAQEGGSFSCTSVSNPICAPTTTGSAPGTCAPSCPAGMTYAAADQLCHSAPAGSPSTCAQGTTAVNNSAGVPVDCTAAPLPTSANIVSTTINSGTPNVYRIDFSGYIGTTADGTCPTGTTYTSSVTLTPTTGSAITAPACAFTVSSEVKYLEGTNVTVKPTSDCGGGIVQGFASLEGGAPCFFSVQALGTVVLKTGVNCGGPGEPANGTHPIDFAAGAVYECVNGSLMVSRVPMPGVKITLHAVNGYFAPTCIPTLRATPAPTATVTPVVTPTPAPTATPAGTTTPAPAGTSKPAFCGPPGVADTQVVTNQNGIAGAYGNTVQFSTSAQPPIAVPGGDETIVGQFLVDQAGIAAIPMYVTFHFPAANVPCDTGLTDSTGTAQCTVNVGAQPVGTPIPVDTSFLYNCTEYDTSTSFTVGAAATPVPVSTPATQPAPAGICVVRSGYGTLTVTATYASTVNTQPAISSGPVVLGVYGVATATVVPTATATIVPTTAATAVATTDVTSTVVPSPAATATGTPAPQVTSTATAAPTATARPVSLSFSLDAARVGKSNNPGNLAGLDAIKVAQKVRLMMYYTISGMPRRTSRLTTYDIRDATGRSVFKVSFKGTEPAGDTGHFVRYTYFVPPSGLPVGLYKFRATLTIAGRSQTRVWRFAIAQTPPHLKVARDVRLGDHASSGR